MHAAKQALEDGEIDDDVALEPQVCRSERNSLLCTSRLFLGLEHACMTPRWRLCGMQHKRQKLSVPSPPRDIPKAKPRLRVPSPPPVPVPTHSDRKDAKRGKAKGSGGGKNAAAADAASTEGFVNLYAADVRACLSLRSSGRSCTPWIAQVYLAAPHATGRTPSMLANPVQGLAMHNRRRAW
jgi:hypothetical protein